MRRVLVLTVILMMVFSSFVFAKPADKAKPILNYDADGDKIFENLYRVMEVGQPSDKYKVIVLFNEDVSIPGLKKQLGDFNVKFEYKYLKGFAGEMTKGHILALAKMPFVKQIQLDAEVKAYMDTAKYWFGVEKAVADFGLDGDRDGNPTSYSKNDVVVAVIDTGIDGNHVDLDGGKIIAWYDFVNGKTTPYDDHGHGTHVAATIAGTGEGNINYRGVAPGAALIGLKVLNSNGSGTTSDIDAAIQWCIDNKDIYGIDIISMSLGSAGSSDGTDSTSQLLQQAYNAGIVPVVAAGNEGPADYTIGSPAAAEYAITVGAQGDVGEQGFFQAYFSSRGPTADGRIKPDISAPGWYIMSAKANTTNGYTEMSGTSMATPFCSGTIALMLDANPSLTPGDIKNILMNTAVDWGPAGKDIDYGAGRLQAYEAIKAAGGYNGTGIAVPPHFYASETLAGTGNTDIWYLDVTDTSYPIAVTLVMPGWYQSGWWIFTETHPDFDLYVYDPNGNLVASSETSRRQEDVHFTPTMTGTYKIHVYSYADSGDYFFDVSAGANSVILYQDQ
ncbi:peptidase S8 [Anoxybacter fermentans]|uniref:Peptidase S8 n=1 Tax=Anoxybacter fermentans TaxID=1323375 RepID=A0A3Q9HQ57_9FIRM|nr:S8 family serine peptidase [Anoxybacter fermentans]AZR72129.1 peptidase S8 [Anoxybacter fermentans]